MSMHETLSTLYEEMMPLCSGMSAAARALAGLGALVSISFRIWRTMADGEPIQLIPLLRPFGTCILIAFFPTLVLGTMNSILGTIAEGTEMMLENETFSMAELRKVQEAAERKSFGEDPDMAFLESDEAYDRELESLGWSAGDILHMTRMFFERTRYAMELHIREYISDIMQLVFDSSSLIIDIIRTFFLVVLSILGPISFALSTWKGLESSMGFWIARYIQIHLWLPVSNIFSCILLRLQTLIVGNDMTDGDGNWTYILFMIIGSIGYFCVPTVSQWIVQAGGAGHYTAMVNTVTIKTAGGTGKATAWTGRNIYAGIKRIATRGDKKENKTKETK